MRLLWLADVLRAAGLTVFEVAGWQTRQVPGTDYGPVKGTVIHETRGSSTSTDAGEIGVLVNGRVGLSGPIAQLYLSRTGAWHVVAAGMCHHVKIGWAGPFAGYGNDSLLGIEAQHAYGEVWTARQYDSYVRGVAAIHAHTGWPVAACIGHKEHQPGDKTDPSFNMDDFRADVVRQIGADHMSWSQILAEAPPETLLADLPGVVPVRVPAPGAEAHPAGVMLAYALRHAYAVRLGVQQLLKQAATDRATIAGLAAAVDRLAGSVGTLRGIDPTTLRVAVADGVREGLAAVDVGQLAAEEIAGEVVDELTDRIAAARPTSDS